MILRYGDAKMCPPAFRAERILNKRVKGVKEISTTVENTAFIGRFIEALGTDEPAVVQRKLGIPYQSAKNYLQGRLPASDVLIVISEKTGVSIHWLLTGNGTKWVKKGNEIGEESPVYLGEKEREIIQELALEKGQAFDEQVRDLVLEALKARDLVTDQVVGVDLVFFGREVPKLKSMRLWGEIAAGRPIDVCEEFETVLVPEEFFVSGRDNFALRVRGDSMIEEGILEGDIIICYQSPTANNGDTVVALIDGSQATVKKFYRERNQIRLQPKSPRHQAIILPPDRVTIQGIVTGIYRRTV